MQSSEASDHNLEAFHCVVVVVERINQNVYPVLSFSYELSQVPVL
jgi:hypothetical protein